LEVDKQDWMESFQKIVSKYLENSNSESNQNIRSHFLLNNALRLVQSAIAQEAILAGEPLIHKLHELYLDELLISESCEKIILKNSPFSDYPLSCSIRGNKLLMKNLLHYAVFYKNERDPSIFQDYTLAYKEGNISKLALIIHPKLNQNRIKFSKNKNEEIYSVSINLEGAKIENIRLPTPDELKSGYFIYSENMSRLITMQRSVIEALTKVAPTKRETQNFTLLKVMALGQ
jgi:hypothetical protein